MIICNVQMHFSPAPALTSHTGSSIRLQDQLWSRVHPKVPASLAPSPVPQWPHAHHVSGFHVVGWGWGSTLPSCTHMGLSLGTQPRVHFRCFIHNLIVEPFSMNLSWQCNWVTELSKKTPPLGILKPFLGMPGSVHTWRSSNPTWTERRKSASECSPQMPRVFQYPRQTLSTF